MASHWPVIVGINQYQFLQPLMYAQFDALELRDFLVNEVGLPAEQCSLLTDVSAVTYQGAAAPTGAVLRQRLVQSCDRAGPEDTVWFFFSGYGVQWQGRDYLLPIDADPNRIELTGLPVEAVLTQLGRGPQRHSVVMLDINRHQSALPPAPGNDGLGSESLALAQQLGIPLVLSCQPGQFSQETLAVRHGLFTEALIEGMRFHGCLTLAQLVEYLRVRVPELCQHHWRPVQDPVAVLPQGQQYLMLVPPHLVGQMPVGVAPPLDPLVPDCPPPPDVLLPESPPPAPGAPLPPTEHLPGAVVRPWPPEPLLPPPPPESRPPEAQLPEAQLPEAQLPEAQLPEIQIPDAQIPEQSTAASGMSWPQWVLATAGLLLLGILGFNLGSLWRPNRSPDPLADAAADPPGSLEEEVAVSPPAAEAPTLEPLFPTQAVSGAEALERARTALAQRQFGEALGWLGQIPEVERPADYQALVDQAETGYASASLSGNSALDEARRLIEPLPASLFNDAIEQARQVPANDPAFDQAQADIQRWSRVILDLAEGRAASGDLEGAIAAVRLVPDDQGEIWAQAQARLQQWEQRRVNRRLLQEAQSVLQPDQATSFQAAIALAQQIPPDYPESPIAQERIDQWSRDILAIARARAAAGQLPGAISAAGLVPSGTSAYDQAQAEIRRWQEL